MIITRKDLASITEQVMELRCPRTIKRKKYWLVGTPIWAPDIYSDNDIMVGISIEWSLPPD